MPAVWGVLVRMLAEAAGSGNQGPSATGLLKGGRKYLERGFVEHVTSVIHANRAQVRDGRARQGPHGCELCRRDDECWKSTHVVPKLGLTSVDRVSCNACVSRQQHQGHLVCQGPRPHSSIQSLDFSRTIVCI